MRSKLKKFVNDTRAWAAVEFSASLLIFMPMFLIFVDLMLLIMYQADMQRATYILAETMRARTPPLVNDPAITGNSSTITYGDVFFNTYCQYFIFKGNCQYLNVNITGINGSNLYNTTYTYSGSYGNYYPGTGTSPYPIDINMFSAQPVLLISGYFDLTKNQVNNFSLTSYIYQFFMNYNIMINAGKNNQIDYNKFTTLVTTF